MTDYSEVTPSQVEQEIWRLSGNLENATMDLARKAREAAEAEVTYKIKHAHAMLSSDAKTVSDREAEALLETGDLLMERRIKEAHYDSANEVCRTIRAQLSALQTISANLRGLAS